MSFAAILGGVVTLIGTSTNVVVSGLLEAFGERPLGLFEIGKVGRPTHGTNATHERLTSSWSATSTRWCL